MVVGRERTLRRRRPGLGGIPWALASAVLGLAADGLTTMTSSDHADLDQVGQVKAVSALVVLEMSSELLKGPP